MISLKSRGAVPAAPLWAVAWKKFFSASFRTLTWSLCDEKALKNHLTAWKARSRA